jgi:hypothetical protein
MIFVFGGLPAMIAGAFLGLRYRSLPIPKLSSFGHLMVRKQALCQRAFALQLQQLWEINHSLSTLRLVSWASLLSGHLPELLHSHL